MPERLLVVGADAAGMSAASAARRQQSPQQLEIVAFDRGLVGRHGDSRRDGTPRLGNDGRARAPSIVA